MSDLDIIKHIKKELNIKLKKTDKIELGNGYTLNQNREVTGLSLYSCEIKNLNRIISPLKELTNLTELRLNFNKLIDISPLKDLTNLTELDLGNNGISDISALKDLTNLTNLSLSFNQLSDISTLKDLTKLTELHLGRNQLRDISPLKDLTKLTTLWLIDNQLSDISPLISLKNLNRLYLNNNYIKDFSLLNNCKNLKELYLGQILELKKKSVTYTADLTNKISDISTLKDLINLEVLDLSLNDIKDIYPLKNLTKLTILLLNNNQIRDISPLHDKEKLKILLLQDNLIEELPSWITDYNMEIQWKEPDCGDLILFKEGQFIQIFNNPLQSPPVEIVKQGKEAIRDYFRSLEEKEKVVKLNEVRILLVGDGMAGKTSLLKKIQGVPFNENESQTHGINVITLPANNLRRLKNIKKIKDCQLHFWDFGGQEIMHATHQFFLSERSLYILVLDSRTDSKKHYWFKHIEKYGGDSPLIVVMNKVDENPNYNIEQKKINDSFPNIDNRFFRVSCKSKEGIGEFITCLGKTIPKTSLFGTDINIDWINIKNRLVKETQANNYISRDEFVKICNENNVDDESSQLTLLKFLHDLGVVLFFERLKLVTIYVLDPHWVTIGVYKIINSAKTKDGILKEQDLDYILNKEIIKKEEYDPAKKKKITYRVEEQRYIIDIMMQFELCYEYDEKKNYYIIPDKLPKELENEPELKDGIPLHFVMRYDYLPSPIISRLMIRLKNDIVRGQQWKYGMILENEKFNCKAKVKSDELSKAIEITVQGELRSKREYFAVIRHHLNDINRNFENLIIEELIPLPGHPDILVEYQALIGHEKEGIEEYFEGKLRKRFSVSELLDGIEEPQERVKRYRRESGKGDVYIQMIQKVDQKVDVDVKVDVRTELPEIQREFDELKELLEEVLPESREKLERISSELDGVTPKSEKSVVNGALNKAARYLRQLWDEDSDMNRALKGVKKGLEYGKKGTRLYNKIAPFIGLPPIPGV